MIAITLHVYYIELWPYFKGKLEKLNTNFDLYVTLSEGNPDITSDILESFPSAKIYTYKNKGMDIGPFLLLLKKIRNKHYEYIIKLHTKNNGNNIDKNKILIKKGRRVDMNPRGYKQPIETQINYLIGSDENIQRNILRLNKDNYRMLGHTVYVQKYENEVYSFVPGTMFMADFKILMQIYTDNLIDKRYDPMPVEYYTGHTPTHLQERQFGQDLMDNGYYIYGERILRKHFK